MAPESPSLSAVDRFVRSRFDSVSDVELLKGGMWSTAFGFESAGEPLVVRFGHHLEDYEKDAHVAAWTRPGLPIPAVLAVGEAFDGVFAVSQRMYGDKLDELPPDRIGRAVAALIDTLVEAQQINLPGAGYGGWEPPDGDAPHTSWGDFLASVPDRTDSRIDGWRPALTARPEQHDVFARAQRKLEQLVDRCPNPRQIVHGDLLAGNVLVTPGNEISAIFDWGNSLAGDPLYDLAWLMFWAPWHPGIDTRRARRAATRFTTATDTSGAPCSEADIDERLLCYQLHIAMDGMQYQAVAAGEHLAPTAARTQRLLTTS